MALLGRGSLIGTRMLSRPAATVLTENAKRKAAESNGIFDLILEEQISRIKYSESTKRVTGIVTESGRNLQCGVVVLAIGVDANVGLARDAGLSVRNGIIVNRHMECCGASEEIPQHSIYSAGDCTEIPDLLASFVTKQPVSAVWKNWASAREEGVAAARSMLGMEDKDPVVFNHTLRLFDMYLGGIGCFEPSINKQKHILIKEQSHKDDYMKIVFLTREKDDAKLLVGAEVIGPSAKDFRRASGVVRITKMLKWIPSSLATPEDMIDKGFNWTKLWKNMKDNSDIESAHDMLGEYLESVV